MNFKKNATGVRAVIFDISGTVLDFGSCGPVAAFVELFARHNVSISAAEARQPMGVHKRDHIWMVLTDPVIGERWAAAGLPKPTLALLDRLCAEFAPLQTEVLKHYCDVIPGAVITAAALRERGIKFANTTGYESGMIKDLIRLAAEGGYSPDAWVCPDHVGTGRPWPWMIFHAARQLGVYPLSTFVKVGDTPADVAEGHAAGNWVVSVVRTGNEVGLPEAVLAALPEPERQARIANAHDRLAACGPHYLIDSVADLLPVLDEISTRILQGETPPPAGFAAPVTRRNGWNSAPAMLEQVCD